VKRLIIEDKATLLELKEKYSFEDMMFIWEAMLEHYRKIEIARMDAERHNKLVSGRR
jgi:hypothetical protein